MLLFALRTQTGLNSFRMMDRPEKAWCFQCKNQIGWIDGTKWIWTCDLCGERSQLNRQGEFIPARAEMIALERKIADLNSHYEDQKRPYLIYIPKGRGHTGDYLPPTGNVARVTALGPAFLLGGVGVLLLFFRKVISGFLMMGLAFLIFCFLRYDGRRRAKAYEALTQEQRLKTESVVNDIRALIDKTI